MVPTNTRTLKFFICDQKKSGQLPDSLTEPLRLLNCADIFITIHPVGVY
jgi:hypothetical protein